jgi:hypothetical protein
LRHDPRRQRSGQLENTETRGAGRTIEEERRLGAVKKAAKKADEPGVNKNRWRMQMPPTDPDNQKTQKGPVKEPDTDESVVADGPLTAVRLHQFDHISSITPD